MRCQLFQGVALLLATAAGTTAFASGLSARQPLPATLRRGTVATTPSAPGRRAGAAPMRAMSPAMALDPAMTAKAAKAVALGVRGGAVGIGSAASLLPPVATLVVAALTKQVTIALLVGIWAGNLLLSDLSPIVAFLRTFDTHVAGAIADPEHTAVLLFTLILGGTIALVQKGGGAQGLANFMRRFAKDADSCLKTAAALATLVFFDDYSSILIVGNSFRPLVQMLNVSKEKFAAIIHFLGVPVSSMAPVSSWIGLQVGACAGALGVINDPSLPGPFMMCMKTIPYRVFPIGCIMFVIALLTTKKDFGPMLEAVEATNANAGKSSGDKGGDSDVPSGPLDPKPETPLRAMNALLPFGTIIGAAFFGMVLDGKAALAAKGVTGGFVDALSNCDSVKALLWSSSLGWMMTMVLLLGQRILDVSEAMTAFTEGMREVIEPCIVLALAWALGDIIKATGTAEFIAKFLMAGGLPAWGLPALTSVLAYVISFATGSSFGTMGILFPLVGPLAWTLGNGDVNMLTHCFGSVLGGSIFGNTFSPIADTTILTVLATRIPLAAHVATAAPYALLIGACSLVLGDIGMGLKLYGPAVALGLVAVAQTTFLSVVGRKAKNAPTKA